MKEVKEGLERSDREIEERIDENNIPLKKEHQK